MPAKVFVDTHIRQYSLIRRVEENDDRHRQAAGYATLFSEDMQHGQTIEGCLTIVNPFRSVAKD